MTMTYAQQAVAASDAAFIPVVTQAAIKVAQDIASEPTTTPGHEARAALSLQVLRSPEVFGPMLAKGVVADGTTDKSAADASVYNRIAGIWNGYAGA
jgi:hypothetical protein